MVGRIFLICLPLLLLASCAQVGTLSGGDKDQFAPVPVKITPAPNQTYFSEKNVSFKFDEFVQLKDPARNVFFVPDDAKPNVQLQGKTMIVSWSEDLRPNTTYVLYMNGAVKDVNEGNDSLMTYVFSTGASIDSLSYATSVADAWSRTLHKGVTVGLYPSDTSAFPLYYSRSDQFGEVHFQNLKQGNYLVRAFTDGNGNKKADPTEMQGCIEKALKLDSSIVDSTAILLSIPDSNYVRSFSYISGHTFAIGGTYPVNTGGLTFNGEPVRESEIRVVTTDSLHFVKFFDATIAQQLVVEENFGSDTLKTRISFPPNKKNTLRFSSPSKKAIYSPNEPILLYSSHYINSIDTSNVRIILDIDSSVLIPQLIFTPVSIEIKGLPAGFSGGAKLILPENCIESNEFIAQRVVFPFTIRSKKELGSLKLDLSDFGTGHYLELLQGDAVIKHSEIDLSNSCLIENLEPGEYSFRIIKDDNGNQRWDSGSVVQCLQPEKVYRFSNLVKVRPNWQVELMLSKEE
jgi:uncharacterized protein (DUF2141 family)